MYILIATAAAGINSGVGLHAAIATPPLGEGSYHTRTRVLTLLLSSLSSGCAAAAYYQEGHGNLWLVAAAGAALSIPYHMLLMSAPVATAIDNSSAPASSSAATSPAAAPLLDSKHDLESSSTVVPPPKPAQRRADRQLAYVQSGVLISPETASSSWTRKYWFGAALSCAAFAGMMSIMASRREAAAISGHNFTF